jgi:hypothetical protein
MSTTNQNSAHEAQPAKPGNSEVSNAQVLADVYALATQFSACVEVFNLIHPAKETDKVQRIALAKLGIQQGRLLIFGDVVGISSPPATIAKHMIPSKPGLTNPEPTLPIHFGVRDKRLDDPVINEKVRAALNQISGRPSYMSREELMEKYGLKSPRRFFSIEYPALDTNRLENFREKYSLLNDLMQATGGRPPSRRGTSMTVQHWQVQNVDRFIDFVKTVRTEVDGLIALMGVKEQVDRGMKLDIKSMGWHPDCRGPILRHDYEKLTLIRRACRDDYPEYVETTEKAISYITEEMRETGFAIRAASVPAIPAVAKVEAGGGAHEQEKRRPSWLSLFTFKSWSKPSDKVSHASKNPSEQQRSVSEDRPRKESLEPIRSKSLSDMPEHEEPFDLDSRLERVPTQDLEKTEIAEVDPLAPVTTANSLVSRHDMYKGVGRVETHEARLKAKDWAAGR